MIIILKLMYFSPRSELEKKVMNECFKESTTVRTKSHSFNCLTACATRKKICFSWLLSTRHHSIFNNIVDFIFYILYIIGYTPYTYVFLSFRVEYCFVGTQKIFEQNTLFMYFRWQQTRSAG